MRATCVWCREPLAFGPPWYHLSDGQTIRQRQREDGHLVDDHVAMPDRSDGS